ncbi:sensor of ECF-type sigma factor [Winogradskyella aurantia]|uniref:Sensor of ECF-type sigma factor n=1 Tax=Winogradskyella aurantia TaxID=1915063 RepID=A0A265US11_9FLAO|nr:sensor of ECF-type sigma factor [Winogradskyella aurantia]OZV68103.1 hypothetical protein CA834_10680 [Winogradskyella aurantia]
MKKFIAIVLFLLSFSSFAQGGEKLRERIKAQKIAFITEQLSLTPDEATKFWPVYNQFETKTEKVRNEDMRNIKMKMRNNPDMSDSEADILLQDLIAAEDKMHRAKIDLMSDLKGIISSKKIIRLKRAEDEFNRKLLERLKEMRNSRGKRD